MNRHHLNKEYCKGCLICVEVCPTNAIKASAKINAKGYILPTVDDMSRCTGCKLCEIVCPDFATNIEVIRDVVPRNNYRTRDGKWVALSCSAEKPFERLMACVGRTDMLHDQRFSTNKERIREANRKIVNEVISDWISSRNLDEVITICEEMGVTIGPIATMDDIARDTHYRDRESIVNVEYPATSIQLKLPNVPSRLFSTPGKIRSLDYLTARLTM